MIILIAVWIEEQTNRATSETNLFLPNWPSACHNSAPPQGGRYPGVRFGGGEVHVHSLFCDACRAHAVFHGFYLGFIRDACRLASSLPPFACFPPYHRVILHVSLPIIRLYNCFSCAKRAHSKEATGRRALLAVAEGPQSDQIAAMGCKETRLGVGALQKSRLDVDRHGGLAPNNRYGYSVS